MAQGYRRERRRRREELLRSPARRRPALAFVRPRAAYSALRLSTTRTALPSERWIVLGSLSFTAHWMLSTL